MLVLSKSARPKAVPVPLGAGAVIFVRPATSAEYFLVKSRCLSLAAGIAAGEENSIRAAAILGEEFKGGNPQDPIWISAVTDRLLLVELTVACAESWKGIGAAKVDAEGVETLDEKGRPVVEPLEMNEATIACLMRDPGCARRIQAVIESGIHGEAAEGNGSAASPSGAAAAVVNTAPDAGLTANHAPPESLAETASVVPK